MATLNFLHVESNNYVFESDANITNNTPGPITLTNLTGSQSTVIAAGATQAVNFNVNKINYNAGLYFPEHNFMGSKDRPVSVTYNNAPGDYITFTW